MESEWLTDADRPVLGELAANGPLGHDELADRLDMDWSELQESIRRLRNGGHVVLTLDRRYAVDENP